MRERTRIGLAALGLALTPLLAVAGDESVPPPGSAPMPAAAPAPPTPAPSMPAPSGARLHRHRWSKSGVCPICMAQAKGSNGRIPMPPTTPQDCAVCQQVAGGGESVPPPGQAMAVAAAANAPGYATVGGPTPVGEPMPIGVMRTNYSQAPSGPAVVGGMYSGGMGGPFGNAGAGAGAPGYAVVGGSGPMAGMSGPVSIPTAPLYGSPGGEHPSLISRILGTNLLAARRERKAREAHAMISYAPEGGPAELPATMVFGR